MSNEDRDRRLYRYPDSDVLRNKLDISDAAALDEAERLLSTQRAEQGIPSGNFDLDHLKAIHKHLFQDVYEWAGQIRQVDFHKGGRWFHPCDRIEMGMADVHKRLAKQVFLRGLDKEQFAKEAGVIIGDVNLVHPFREGNGRTQFQFLKQLGKQAGHNIDLTRFDRNPWIQASIEANDAEYDRMADCILQSITPRERETAKQEAIERAMAKTEQQDREKDEDRSRDDSARGR